jgi:hypothetical protein
VVLNQKSEKMILYNEDMDRIFSSVEEGNVLRFRSGVEMLAFGKKYIKNGAVLVNNMLDVYSEGHFSFAYIKTGKERWRFYPYGPVSGINLDPGIGLYEFEERVSRDEILKERWGGKFEFFK